MPVGYSATPLAKKLGIAPGSRVLLRHPPDAYLEWIAPVPEGANLSPRLRGAVDLVHLFTTRRTELEQGLPELMPRIAPAGAIWVSWPKRAAKVETDVTEDVVRAVALPLGLVDVKVCAVSEVWSGLKLVIRKVLR